MAKTDDEARAATKALEGMGEGDLFAGLAEGRKSLEEQLAEELANQNRKPPRGMIDALSWSLTIHDEDLEGWEPTMKWHKQPVSEAQLNVLVKAGFWPESIQSKGHASAILDKLALRRRLNLATPKQVALMARLGHPNPELESFSGAKEWIDAAFSRKASSVSS